MEINTIRLRKLLGWLGLFLPWIVVILLHKFPDSISSTYYTYQAGPVFMIILGSAGFLLISYKGYDLFDDILNTIAGVFALSICVFPCYNSSLQYVGTFQLSPDISYIIHNSSAIVFFACLSFNSLFRFTKTSGNMTKKKKCRNIIYRICGIGMLGAFALFLLPSFHIKVWLIEAIALLFFGVSWLTKANCYPFLFADSYKKEG